MAAIALHARDGSVRAVARVDDADLPWLSTHRWKLTAKGYAQRERRRNGKSESVRMHRAIMGLEPGDPRQVDHRNGDRLDNRRENLRIVPAAAQAQNVYRGRPRGLRLRRSGRWEARLCQRHVGMFDTFEEAQAAISAARARELPYSVER